MKKHCEEWGKLLSAFVDGELDEDREMSVEDHISRCRDCREHLLELKMLSAEIEGLSRPEPPGSLDKLTRKAYRKWSVFAITASWIVVISLSVSAIFGIWEAVTNPEISLLERILLTTGISGLAAALAVVTVQRFKARRTDPYREVRL